MWIKTSDRLPENNQIVLAKSKKSELGYSVLKLHCQAGENSFWFDDCLGIHQLEDVTHWMALPDPPVELKPSMTFIEKTHKAYEDEQNHVRDRHEEFFRQIIKLELDHIRKLQGRFSPKKEMNVDQQLSVDPIEKAEQDLLLWQNEFVDPKNIKNYRERMELDGKDF